MFTRFIQLLSPRPDDPGAFVEEVRTLSAPPRNRRMESVLIAGWVAIAGKCALVTWLVAHYHLTFSPWWVNAPTIGCGLLCTALYFRRE